MLDDDRLDALLAAEELPAPPDRLLRRTAEAMRARHQPSPDATAAWLARMAQVRDQFRALLSQPQLAGMALATRGGEQVGGVVAEADAALGHSVQGNNVRGQVFLTALESPAGLEVELIATETERVVERTRADELGRFRFLGLDPGTYRMEVPALGLAQEVELNG